MSDRFELGAAVKARSVDMPDVRHEVTVGELA
jgi:hypothetical protein